MAGLLGREPAKAQRNISNSFIVTHVRVLDGERTLQDTQVAVSAGVIRAVGNDLVAWRDLPAIDGTGATLLPGLIDAHAHVRSADDLRQAIRFGVTTVLDMATVRVSERDLFALRSAANTATDMADVRSTGFPAAAPGAHGTEYASVFPTIGTVAEAMAFVAARGAEGSDHLKIMLNGLRNATTGVQNLDGPRVRMLVESAHAAAMVTVAHVETLEDVDVALSAGVDGLAHVWRRGGANLEMARRLAERNVFVVATLSIPDGFLPEGRARLLADSRFSAFLSSSLKEHLGRSFTSPIPCSEAEARANLAGQLAAVQSLHAAGVKLLVGTDASPGNPAAHGISVHRELQLLGQAGLAPSAILAAATMNTAQAFRLVDRGRILPGYRADLLLVRGDPTADVLATRDIARVWKAGVEVDRAEGVR
jgi:imidazolonepropionase-like amidohydrolase